MLITEEDLKRLPKNCSKEFLFHYPVMYREVIEFISPSLRKIFVDCTVGVASHASEIIEKMPLNSIFIGIDKDNQSLEIAKERLKSIHNKEIILVKEDFKNLDKILRDLNIKSVDAFFFDLGISSYQLSQSQRGFSFSKEGPLDMRMDRDAFLCAYDLVNNLSEKELCKIFQKFGEEKFSRRIAHLLVERRKKQPIFTTTQLKDLIIEAVPKRFSYRIHPATRIFQALRIAVNRELDCLEEGLNKAIEFLSCGGRIAIISFHSLEDRIVKNIFKSYASQKKLKIITPKPLRANEEELRENLSSRSAKLRVAEKL
ncbi:MAG: 16S rRNA (cytosine(1402)-N(4))-methyltransferase [Candidatus Omnitrophica bacterium 4484_70.1]|nr:MAG: 16S rRNA (cytosine(1402)-N(4))-methyltransferase [Candidatus Omnitrophica bacterium 4484_70.1]